MATSIKKDTLKGKNVFSEKLDVAEYDASNSMAEAVKSRYNEVGSWNYITSNGTSIDGATHVIQIPNSWGKIGDFYLDILLPAQTYVAHTLTSMIKEIRWNFSSGDDLKYTGETLNFILQHMNDLKHTQIIHKMQNNSASAVTSSKWFTIPLMMIGSKPNFSDQEDLYNVPFKVYKMINQFQFEVDFHPLTKFVTSGSTGTATVRLRFKQYEFLNTDTITNNGSAVKPELYLLPYILTDTVPLTLNTATETNFTINSNKCDAECNELALKLVLDSDYKASQSLLYTSIGLETLTCELKNIKIYDGYGPNIILSEYFNEYSWENTDDVAGSEKIVNVIDFSETPKLLYTQSIGTAGINLNLDSPKISLIAAGSHSAAAATMWYAFVYKSIYIINSQGIVKRFLSI